jgi:hypothetical protein
MATRTKLAGAILGVVAVALTAAAWLGRGAPNAPRGSALPMERVTTPALAAAASAPDPTDGRREHAAASEPEVGSSRTGELRVRVRYATEPTAAAGIRVHAVASADELRTAVRQAVTDAEGHARLHGLQPGTWRVGTTLSLVIATADVAAGTTSECTLLLRDGMTLEGVVVDPSGAPVGGATVEATLAGVPGAVAEPVARTAADGTFALRECFPRCLVGARAEGHAASQLHYRDGAPGSTQHVRIELQPNGGAIDGLVVDTSGRPVEGAVVRVGVGSTEAIRAGPQGAPPLPAQLRTDAAGRFRAIGVAAGTQPVAVRTADHAPWRGTCEVVPGATVAMHVVLTAGVTCAGTVRDDGGAAVADAEVGAGDPGELARARTRSGPDGTFTLAALPIDGFVVAAHKDGVGNASAALRGGPGETVRCELRLSKGLAVRARVVDDAAAPLAHVEVRAEAEGPGPRWTATASSAADGRVVVGDCPPGRTLTLRVGKRDHLFLVRESVQPGGPELELRLPRDTRTKVRIAGRLLRPDGGAAAGEEVQLLRVQTAAQVQHTETAKAGGDGRFAVEVPAGDWLGVVRVEQHPELRFTTGELEPGARWDAGDLQLTAGGTLVVRVDAVRNETDYYTVLDTRERMVCSLFSPAPPLRSQLLAPGDYLLLAQGEGVVAQLLPFTIAAGGETELTLARQPGVRQSIEFALAPGAARPPYVAFQVRSGSKLAAWLSARSQSDAPFRRDVWLAPGTYTLTTENCTLQTSVAFTVGDTEGPPLRLVVR